MAGWKKGEKTANTYSLLIVAINILHSKTKTSYKICFFLEGLSKGGIIHRGLCHGVERGDYT